MFRHFARDRKGATAIEYGLILGLMALVMIVGISSFGVEIDRLFTGNGSEVKEAFDR